LVHLPAASSTFHPFSPVHTFLEYIDLPTVIPLSRSQQDFNISITAAGSGSDDVWLTRLTRISSTQDLAQRNQHNELTIFITLVAEYQPKASSLQEEKQLDAFCRSIRLLNARSKIDGG
jgi:hypothetical protein